MREVATSEWLIGGTGPGASVAGHAEAGGGRVGLLESEDGNAVREDAPAVALVVDDSMASLGAARWAAAVARAQRRQLVVLVLPPAGGGTQDHAAVLARVAPTLESAGVPLRMTTCRPSSGRTARARASAAVSTVREALVGVEVTLLVVPADRPGTDGQPPRHGLVSSLAAARTGDLLVVPGLAGAPPRPGTAGGTA